MARLSHIVFVVLLLLALQACGPKRISKGDMEEIFYLMFLQDQKIKQDRTLKQMADTTLVYAGILESKGYDTDDSLYSLHEYLAEPEPIKKKDYVKPEVISMEIKKDEQALTEKEKARRRIQYL